MSLEATVVCVDNSEWTRNGDYAPNRFQAQADAVNELASAKTQANPENTVGVLAMAGKKPTVLVTPTAELGKVLNSLANLQIEGEASFSASSQIAQLALKHRENKNQRQRIVMFVGSPLVETKEQLVKIAKKLKKNNVAVDVVHFSNCEANEEKLDAFIDAVSSGDSSHLVNVPAGTILLDQLFSTPIYQTEGGGGYGSSMGAEGGGAGGGEGMEFGVDPNMDPELAMVLRISMEEERARQGITGGDAAAEDAAGGTPAATPGAEATAAPAATAEATAGAPEPMEEDALLQQALAMSMDVDEEPVTAEAPSAAAAPDTSAAPSSVPAVAATPAASSAPAATPGAPLKQQQGQQGEEGQPAGGGEEDDNPMEGIDDPELVAALAMSMQNYSENWESGAAATPAPSAAAATAPRGGEENVDDLLNDADYMSNLLQNLADVDDNDPNLQETIRNLLEQDGAAGSGATPDKAKKDDEKSDKP